MKKVVSVIMLTMLLGSNFAFVSVAGATPGPEHPEKKITFCHVPPGNINNPQTLTTAVSAYEHAHGDHELDYMGECIKPDIEIEKIASDVSENDNGTYSVKYIITVENKGGTGFYTLTDEIELPDGVDADVSPVGFSDDDSNPVPVVNPLFNGDDEDTIIENESILPDGKDEFYYKVTYTVDPTAEPSKDSCEEEDDIDLDYVKKEDMPNDFVLVENYAAVGEGDNQEDDTCIELKIPKAPAKIVLVVADKIICENEEDLPNWGTTDSTDDDITEDTVSNFLEENENCELAPKWEFNLTYGDYSTTFVGETELELVDGVDRIAMREVEQEGYIGFAGGTDSTVPSAEMYCHKDVLNYDNLDYIDLEEEEAVRVACESVDLGGCPIPEPEQDTYYCVAFNVLEEAPVLPEAFPVCEDGNNYAKITLNEDAGGLDTVDDTLWFGNSIAPTGVWFELPAGAETSSHTEGAVLTYNGSELSVDLLRDSEDSRQDFAGTIEFHGNGVTGVTTADLQTSGGHPDTFEKVNDGEVVFDLAVTTGDDHGKVQLEDEIEYCPVPEATPECEDGKRYARVVLDEEAGGLNTAAGNMYYGNSTVQPNMWFELVDAPTSVETEGAILTYEDDVLVVDLLKDGADAWQDFAGTIELYGAAVVGDLVEGRVGDEFYKLEDSTYSHEDMFTKDEDTVVTFDFATTTAHDEGSMTLEDREVECPVSDVTLCKIDTRKNPLEGWNLQLLGSHIEQVVVPVDNGGPTSSLVDLEEGNYVLVANGTYEYRGNSGLINDASFSQRLEGDGFTGPYFPWINAENFSTPGNLAIKVNGSWNNWSEYLAGDHKYALGYEDYEGTFDFTIYDNVYTDNEGEMTVDIYNGYAGTTGEKGCVTFEDVPYGEYSVDETLEVEWVNVEGLGDVVVDEESETYYVINQAPISILPGVEPICQDGKRYAKITINEDAGGMYTIDDTVWFGDSIAPTGVWFELPIDEQTSSHNEGVVLTYDNDVLTVGLHTSDTVKRQDFAGTIELYGAKVSGDIVEGTGIDKFEGPDSFHEDTMTKVSNTVIDFDLAVTTAHDVATMKLKNKTMYCNDPFRIVARKIVCEDESELPDSYDFGGKISNNTAQKWVDTHKSCSLVEGWSFEYGVNNISVPNGSYVGEAPDAGWTTSKLTNSKGKTVMSTRNLENVTRIKIREVLQEDYIPFSDARTNEPSYSAEMYCGTDVTNYDNEEWIKSPEYGQTVYCVAWNVPAADDPLTKCENDFSVNNEKDLSIIDLSNGNQVYVNDLAFGSSAAAVDPVSGNVYYIENETANPRLAYYDITTHTNTIIGVTGATSKLFTKMAFNIDGTLYAMTDYTNSNLYSIDVVSGVATHIDATPRINQDGGDLIFDDKGKMYVIAKGGIFYKVDVTPTSTLAHNMGIVKYNDNPVQSTGLTFKDGLFYVTDNSNNLYSFSLADITDLTKVTGDTNSINDLASCPADLTYRDVTICKQDPTGAPLSGWNLQLLGGHIEQVEVLSTTGLPYSSSELDEGNYVLVASGEYKYRGSDMMTDANYSQRLMGDSGYFDGDFPGDYFPWVNINGLLSPYEGMLGIMVNDEETNWSDYYASNHKYALGYEAYEGKFDFRISDSYYGDNVGNLTVDIYEGYAGTTGDNGCITFEDVDFGEYVVAETLEVDWVNVTGLDEVTVNEEDEIFYVVNRDTTIPEEPETGSVHGYKWNDNNNNSEWEKGCFIPDVVPEIYNTSSSKTYACYMEFGIDGWEITLTSNGDDATVYNEETDEEGYYSFSDIPVGEYTLCEIQQRGWTQTYPVKSECYTVTIGTPDEDEDFNFGNHKDILDPNSLHGYVFGDDDNDGEWDEEEDGVEGWEITLESMDDLTYNSLSLSMMMLIPDPTIYNVFTNGDGYYLFEDIPTGAYELCEVPKSSWTQTYPVTNNCYKVNVGAPNGSDYNFGNHLTPTTGGGSTPKAACVDLEIVTDLGTSDGSVEIICRGNEDTGKFRLDCGNGSELQIKDAIGGTTPYASFTCEYDISDTTVHNPVCSVSKVDPVKPLTYNWITPVQCEAELGFTPKVTTYEVEEEVVAGGGSTPEEIPEETDGGRGGIDETYDDYTDKMKKLADIEDDETTEGVSDLKASPELLLKTGTPISERVQTLTDNRVETVAPAMTASYVNDINVWKAKLPESDRTRSEYIVVPSNGLIVPVNYISKASDDYDELINGKEIDVNKYLQSGVMNYPGTSSSYGEVGNKVIFGHSSYWKIDEGKYKTQFQKIIELDVGEEIWVYKLATNGDYKRFVYKVSKSFETAPINVGVLDQGVGSNITLITCTPIGGITARWVVQAKYVNEEKAELQNYLYGKNISSKYRLAISDLIRKIEALDKNQRAMITLKIFSRIEEMEEDLGDNNALSDVLKYLKLQLAISYNKA